MTEKLVGAALFNRLYPVGTPITLPRLFSAEFGRYKTTTTSEAKPTGIGSGLVCVEGLIEAISLDDIEIDYERAPHLKDRTLDKVLADEAEEERRAAERAAKKKTETSQTQEHLGSLDERLRDVKERIEAAQRGIDELARQESAIRAEQAATLLKLEELKAS